MSINGQCRADTSQPHVSLLVNFLAKETVGVTGRLEVDVLQYILRGTPGSLNTSPSNWVDGLSSGVDAFNEILNLEEEEAEVAPKYDYPIINNNSNNRQLEKSMREQNTQAKNDSIIVTIKQRIGLYFTYPEFEQSVNDTSRNRLIRKQDNHWTVDSIIFVRPLVRP